jgi:hypothetical protein
MSGWICLHRKLQQSTIWDLEPFSYGQAWVDLLLSANHKPGTILVRGVFFKVQRGQVGVSEYTLAKKWKWSRGKVRRFLEWLETEGQVVLQKNNVTSLVTIVKYDDYQHSGTASDTASDTTDGLQVIPQTDTNNKKEQSKQGEEGRQVSGEVSPKPPLPKASENGQPKSRKKRDKLIIPYSPDFEAFWKAFPNVRKTNKPKAFEIWPSAVQSIILERMCDGEDAVAFLVRRATEYAASEQGKSKWCRGPCPWLNQAAWNDPAEAWLDKSRERPLFQTLEPADKVQARQQAEFGGKFSPMFAHLEGQQNGNT